jgi:hypothetical protein
VKNGGEIAKPPRQDPWGEHNHDRRWACYSRQRDRASRCRRVSPGAMRGGSVMTNNPWEAGSVSPWKVVQLVVSLHPGGGARIAKLVPEEWIRRDGAPVVYRTLHLWSDPFDFLRSPPEVRVRKLREGRIPMRTVRLFREACAKVDGWWRAGRLVADVHPAAAGVPRRVTTEYSTQDIDFERGRICGEGLRLYTASALKAWEEDERVKQCPDERTRLTEEHTDRQEISVSEDTAPSLSREAKHHAAEAEAPKMAASNRTVGVASKVASPKTLKIQVRWGPAIKRTTHDVLRNEGPRDPDLPKWSRKSHLEQAVRNRLPELYPEETKDDGPGSTTLKRYVGAALMSSKKAGSTFRQNCKI